jgi:hypothetical protein
MGMEIPKRAPTMLILSKREYCRVEEMTPAMSPMKAAMRMERKESWRVKRNRPEKVDHRSVEMEMKSITWDMVGM